MAAARKTIEQFRSSEEAFFYRMSHSFPQFVEELRNFEVERVVYEGKTFRIGETTYTPDFNLTLRQFGTELRVLVNVEVKGSKKQRGYVTTRARLSIAASSFPEYVWVEVLVDERMKVFNDFEILQKRPLVYLTKMTGV